MRCRTCGATVRDERRECPRCRARLRGAFDEPSPPRESRESSQRKTTRRPVARTTPATTPVTRTRERTDLGDYEVELERAFRDLAAADDATRIDAAVDRQ